MLLCMFTSVHVHSQGTYTRMWGSLVPYSPGSLTGKVNEKTNELYLVNPAYLGEILVYNTVSTSYKSFYKIPGVPGIGTSLIENIEVDSRSNLIISGRTLLTNLATPGAYSTTPIVDVFSGSGFVAKVSAEGKLVWFTYYHPPKQNTTHLAVDKFDNIYILANMDKNTVLPASSFQSTGDPKSSFALQNIISKLDTNGQHLWTTFYSQDQSRITSIKAGDTGLYVYGDHFLSTSASGYFGTTGTHQQYATGVSTGSGNDSSTAFLSKFNFNGTRAWSTYFGNQISKGYQGVVNRNLNCLAVLNDEAYILTFHQDVSSLAPSLATKNAFLPQKSEKNLTLSKFRSDGKRDWTSYIHAGDFIMNLLDKNSIVVSGSVESNDQSLTPLITNGAYQTNHGGGRDSYTMVVPDDGQQISYGSFYGYGGTESGIVFPTTNGFYIVGYTAENSSATSPFLTDNSTLLLLAPQKYGGIYISYFMSKRLGTEDFKDQQISIYPNPVKDLLNIQSKNALSEGTRLTIFDVTGRRIQHTSAQSSDLNQVDVASLTPGVYLLQVSNGQYSQSFKFIKN